MAIQQDLYIAIRDDDVTGTGTWGDPYDGSSAAKFDDIMANRVTTGQTVRLLPGTFQTTGHSGASGSTGWAAKEIRLVGSGMGSTTLQLTGLSSATRYVIGTDFANVQLDRGFEVSDLTIDCNLTAQGPNTSVGAIRLRGRHVHLRRLKIINYGTKVSSGEIQVVTAAGEDSENCIIEDCVADAPPSSHAGAAIIYAFEGESAGHRLCAIRNCAARGAASFEPPPGVSLKNIGISPGIGIGTVIEGNQLANLGYAIFARARATKDLVIWNNHIRNVNAGIHWDQQNAPAARRIIVTDNMVELSRDLPAPVGFRFAGNAGADRFHDIVTRKNIIRQVDDPTRPLRDDAGGIAVFRCTRLIAENNIIEHTGADSAVFYENCFSVKFFNNQDQSGNLLRGYNRAQQRSTPELEDAVQDMLLAL